MSVDSNLGEALLPQNESPPAKKPCISRSMALQLLAGTAIAMPYTGPAAFALIVRGWAYFNKGGEGEILQVIPGVLDDIWASSSKLMMLGVYVTATAEFTAIFHLMNIRDAIIEIVKKGREKGCVAATMRLLAYVGYICLCAVTGGLGLSNNLSGLLFAAYAFKVNPSPELVAFLLWLPLVINALGNGSWSQRKIEGLHGLVQKLKQARRDKSCRVVCNRRLSGFMAMVAVATVISYSFYAVYSQDGCRTIYPVFNQLRKNDYDLGFTNFTNTTLERIDKEMNDGQVGFNSTALEGMLQFVCVLDGIYYALRYITMVAMRIALPLVQLDWQQSPLNLCCQITSVAILLGAAVALLAFPSAGQVVNVKDEVDFQFIFDLACFVVGSTSNNVVKVMGKPRQGVERCCRSIFRKPRQVAPDASDDNTGQARVSMMGLGVRGRRKASSVVVPV